jgi:hypothetical protein
LGDLRDRSKAVGKTQAFVRKKSGWTQIGREVVVLNGGKESGFRICGFYLSFGLKALRIYG